MEQPEIYYREVNAYWSEDRLAISLEKYRVVKRTPRGVWIAPMWDYRGDHKRFVLDGSGRRYAYPTREQARESFIIRKRREIQHCALQHDRAVRYLALAETMQFPEDGARALRERDPLEIIYDSPLLVEPKA